MTETTVIGKVTESRASGFTIEYPSVAGIKTMTVGQGDLIRFEVLGDERVALLVNDEAGQLSGDGAPLIVTVTSPLQVLLNTVRT